MIHRIEVGFKKRIRDAKGENIKKRIIEDLGIEVEKVNIVDVYTIEADLSESQLIFLGENLFVDPIIQEFSIDKPLIRNFDWLIEVGFRPGVTDNVGKTSKEAIEDILRKKLNGQVYTSKKYLISGEKLKKEDLERIAKDLLANELIQRWLIIDNKTFIQEASYLPIPKVEIPHRPTVAEINLNVSDENLLNINKERKLALNLQEMQVIKEYFLRPEIINERKKVGLGQNPTDAELEAIAQTWSEHCKHKIFNAKIVYRDEKNEKEINSLFKTYIKSSTEKLKEKLNWVVSTLWDNSGVMKFNDD